MYHGNTLKLYIYWDPIQREELPLFPFNDRVNNSGRAEVSSPDVLFISSSNALEIPSLTWSTNGVKDFDRRYLYTMLI